MLVSLVSITATNRPAPDAESGTIATRMPRSYQNALDGVESCPAPAIVVTSARLGHIAPRDNGGAARRLGGVEPGALVHEQVGIVEPLDEVAQDEVAVVTLCAVRALLQCSLHRREAR